MHALHPCQGFVLFLHCFKNRSFCCNNMIDKDLEIIFFFFLGGGNLTCKCKFLIESIFFSKFLLQIMEETNTQIAWPSKLKIGAKSKKGKSYEMEKSVVVIMQTVEYLQVSWGLKSTFILITVVPKYLLHSSIWERLS